MERLSAVNVYFHPEMTVVAAARVAKQLGCVLAWRGSGFVLRRVPPRDTRSARRAPRRFFSVL